MDSTKILPTVSVIVPVYNVENYISRCIESILSQSYSSWELILVDDGSYDNSGIICDEYGEKNERISVVHKVNGGVSSARNAGIDYATGEWLCFVDSDDYIAPGYLENFHLSDDSTDLYAQGYRVIKGDKNSVVDFQISNDITTNELVYLLEKNNILNSPCFKLFNRAIVNENRIRFNLSMSYGEDHLFSLQYLHFVNNVKYFNGSMYTYFQETGASLTRRTINPMCYLDYIDSIIPEMNYLCQRFEFPSEDGDYLINHRLHFHILRATINYTKTESSVSALNRIKNSLKTNRDNYNGLSKTQILFMWCMERLNVNILSFLLMVNERLGLSKKLKIGF